MRTKQRLLSVFMIVCMLISCATFSASAASNGKIKFKATQNYSDAQKVLELINKQRSKKGLATLKLDKTLCKAAAKRAAELAVYIPETSPHKRPNGSLVRSINSRIIYECSAEGYETPKAAVNGWMTSPPHKKGILLSNAKSVGIGCLTTQNGIKYWTLEFSASKAKSVVKSKKKVTSTYKISTLSKYIKKSKFHLGYKDNEYGWGLNVEVGDTAWIVPYYSNGYFDTQLRPSDYKWKSSKKSVATVNSRGKITAKKAGTTYIYATMKNSPKYKLKFKVKIVKPYDDYDDYDFDDDYYTYYE